MSNFYQFLLNILVFFAIVAIVPGLNSPNGPIPIILVGSVFSLIMIFLTKIVRFFKFPDSIPAKLIFGTILNSLLFFLIQAQGSDLITLSKTYIGGSNFLFFNIPKIFEIQDLTIVVIYIAFLLTICSIILTKLAKIK